jgi:hypothetical protein
MHRNATAVYMDFSHILQVVALAFRTSMEFLRAYVLQAVQPEVCTAGMLANFNQAPEAW